MSSTSWSCRRARKPGGVEKSGIRAFALFFKAIALLVGSFAALRSGRQSRAKTRAKYGLAYTFELGLSLASYFGNRESRRDDARILLSRGHSRGLSPKAGSRAGKLRSDHPGVRAARVDPDSPRPPANSRHEGGRISDARDGLHDRAGSHDAKPPRLLPDRRRRW